MWEVMVGESQKVENGARLMTWFGKDQHHRGRGGTLSN